MTLGSFFDGIGGWLLAANHAGVEPVWASEIDDFPAAVTAHHFPQVKQLGDITKINVDKLEPVDIICAGSPCFVAGTSILTYNGIKAVEDVQTGDMVLGDDCKWHKVVKTMVNPASVIYAIKAQGLLETKATANHPVYVRHMKRHYSTYEDGRRGNKRVFSEPEYVAVKDLKKGDFIGFPILQTSENRMGITLEEAWLIGRYIADGYVNNSQRSGRPIGQLNHKVIYCIGKGKLDNFKSHVDKYHVCLKKDVTVTKGEIISERLMKLCLMCGHGAGNKEIPGAFLNLPKPLLKAMIDGYMSGDGCKTKGRYQATTISRGLALSLQVAVHKTYEVPVKIYFTKRPPKAYIQGREINQHDTYQLTWLDEIPKQSQAIVDDGYIWQPIKSITKAEIETSVYNFEVDDVHSYTANGMMVHNCQDLSVAGKREGLAGERSGLFVDAVKLVHGLRERTGKPRYFVWENVPGAFSSNKGLDFRAVLEEITKTEIPMPKDNKWAEAGMVEWAGGSLAWRVLDAQYWGVPQRRKRIFLVADFGGFTAGEILFESQGVPGDSEKSQGAGQTAPRNAGANVDSTSYGIDHVITTGGKCTAQGKCYYEERCPTMKAGGVHAVCAIYSFDSLASNSMKSKNPHSGCRQVEVSKTLDTTTPDPSKNQGGIAIFDMTHANNPVQSYNGKKCHTLTSRMGTGGNQVPVVHSYCIAGNTIDRHAVAYSMGHDERSAQFTPNKTDPLTASDYKQPPIVGALCARDYKGVGNQFVDEGEIVVGSLCAHDGRGFNGQDVEQNKVVYPAGKVRRLTTTECERLQGLPDEECLVLLDLKNEKVVFIRWLEYQKSPVQYAEDKCHKKQRFVGIAERSRLLESVLSAEKNLHSSNRKINKPVRKSAPINSEEYVQEIHSLWEWLRNACSVGKNLETHLQKQNQNSVQSNVLMNIEKESITHNGETEQQSKERTMKKDECGANALEQFGKEIMQLVKDAEKPMTEVVEGSQFIIFDLTEIAKKQGMLWTILSFFAPNVMHTLILRQGNTVALSIGTKGYTDIEFNGKPAPDSRRYKALGNGMAMPCADYVIKRIAETCIGNA